MTEQGSNYRWVLRFSSIAFLALVLQQNYVVVSHVPNMMEMYKGFGADLPDRTVFIASWYQAGCALFVLVAVFSAGSILLREESLSDLRVKQLYVTLVLSVVGTLAWTAFVTSALYAPVFRLGAPI